MEPLRQRRRYQNDFIEELERKQWYHSFEGIDGVMPLEWLRERWKRFPIPADLTAMAADPVDSPADDLVDVPIVLTLVDGEVVHRSLG